MRSTEDPIATSGEERKAQARRVGAYLTRIATEKGFDVRVRMGGRHQLAEQLGVSLTTVSRTLDGKTLPLPTQLRAWAELFSLDLRNMLVETGIFPDETGDSPAIREVASAPLSPGEAMDALGITDPKIRTVLNGNIVQAIELQEALDAKGGRGAMARG